MTRKIKRKLPNLLALVFFGVLCLGLYSFGCGPKQSFVETGYDSIKVSNSFVDDLMTQLGKEYRAGNISKSEKQKISRIYRIYKASADLADESLADYASSKTQKNRQKYLDALESLSSNKSKFIKLSREILND